MARFLHSLRPRSDERRPSRLNGGKEIRRDDGKPRRRLSLPLLGRIWPRNAPAGVGVLHHSDPVPDDRAPIELAREDAITALAAAIQSGGIPEAAARRRNLISVQPDCDRARRRTGRVLGVDSTDDLRLLVDDHHLAWLTGDCPVSVGAAASSTDLRAPARLGRAGPCSRGPEEKVRRPSRRHRFGPHPRSPRVRSEFSRQQS